MFKKKRWKVIGTILFILFTVKAWNGVVDYFGGSGTGAAEDMALTDLEYALERTGYESFEITDSQIVYSEKFWPALDLGPTMGYLSKTVAVRMNALVNDEGKELPGTYRAVLHQLNSDYWVSEDIQVMIEVGDQLSMLEEWTKERFEYENYDSLMEGDYELVTNIDSDEKEEDPTDGTSRRVKVRLKSNSQNPYLDAGYYFIDYYKYPNDQNFWTNGVINHSTDSTSAF